MQPQHPWLFRVGAHQQVLAMWLPHASHLNNKERLREGTLRGSTCKKLQPRSWLVVIFIYLFVVLSLQRPNARDDSLSVCCRALPGTSLTSVAPPTLTACLSSCAMTLRALGWPPLRAIMSRRLTWQVARFHAASSASAVQYAVILVFCSVLSGLDISPVSMQISMDLPTRKSIHIKREYCRFPVNMGSYWILV